MNSGSPNFFTQNGNSFLGNIASDPGTGANGQYYYNTSLNLYKFYINGAFQILNPMTSPGDTVYGVASSGATRLSAGTNGQILTMGATFPLWSSSSSVFDSPQDLQNFSIVTSVAANAMTIALKDKSGSDPSSGSPVKIAFRNATSATGDYSIVSVTGALSIIISSSATLGHTSAVNQYVYLWAINNSGTAELAVSGSRYDIDVGSIQTSTTMSGSATDWNTLYSTSGRSNKAVRLLARIKVNEATAGTWASNSSEISLYQGIEWPNGSSTKSDLTWSDQGFGTTSSKFISYRKINDTMIVKGKWVNGTVAASTAYIGLPSGYTIDTSKVTSDAGTQNFGTIWRTFVAGGPASTSNGPWVLFYDGSDNTKLFISASTAAAAFNKQNGVAFTTSGDVLTFLFEIPITEWRSY